MNPFGLPNALRRWGWRASLAVVVFAALPTIGLFSGGIYAALLFALAGIIVVAEALQGRWPTIDRSLAAIALLTLALFSISATWSIVPKNSLNGSLQMTGVFAGALLVVGLRRPLGSATPLIFRALLAAAIVGPLAVMLDKALGYPALAAITGLSTEHTDVEVKLSRGASHLAILIWPILAYGWAQRRRAPAVVAAALLAIMLVVILSSATAAALSFAAGIVALALAVMVPRLTAIGEAIVITLSALASPWIVRLLEGWMTPFASDIKTSATHRLEIWDYMSARILERPITGWGWLSANALPIHPDELARYRWVGPGGTSHPHDFWLQLWVETGVIGAALGFAFAMVVLWRAQRQPPKARPFALAAVATAFVSSLASFNLATDAWWCAIAATGLLFALLGDVREGKA